MSQELTKQDKLQILNTVLIPSLSRSVDSALAFLDKAKEDYIKLNNIEYYPRGVDKDPIFSVIDGMVRLEMAQTEITKIKKLLGDY